MRLLTNRPKSHPFRSVSTSSTMWGESCSLLFLILNIFSTLSFQAIYQVVFCVVISLCLVVIKQVSVAYRIISEVLHIYVYAYTRTKCALYLRTKLAICASWCDQHFYWGELLFQWRDGKRGNGRSSILLYVDWQSCVERGKHHKFVSIDTYANKNEQWAEHAFETPKLTLMALDVYSVLFIEWVCEIVSS